MKYVLIVLTIASLIGCGEYPGAQLDPDAGIDTIPETPDATMPPEVNSDPLNISKPFTRADHDICDAWPKCPDGIFTAAGAITYTFNDSCHIDRGDGLNHRVNCRPCIDMRTPTCKPFVGRCYVDHIVWDRRQTSHEVPFSELFPVNDCANYITGDVLINAVAVCTGDSQDPNSNASLVCND